MERTRRAKGRRHFSRRLAGLILVLLLPGAIWLLVDAWSQVRLRLALTRFEAAHGARPVPSALETDASPGPAARELDRLAGAIGVDPLGDGAGLAIDSYPLDALRAWLWSEARSPAPPVVADWLSRHAGDLEALVAMLVSEDGSIPGVTRASALPLIPIAQAIAAGVLIEPSAIDGERAVRAIDRLTASAVAAGSVGTASIVSSEGARVVRLVPAVRRAPRVDPLDGWASASRRRAREVLSDAFAAAGDAGAPGGAPVSRATDEPHERHVREQPVLSRPVHRAAIAQLIERLARLSEAIAPEDPCVPAPDVVIDLPDLNPLAGVERPAVVLLVHVDGARDARLAQVLANELVTARALADAGRVVDDEVVAECPAWRWRRLVDAEGRVSLRWIGESSEDDAARWRGPLSVEAQRVASADSGDSSR